MLKNKRARITLLAGLFLVVMLSAGLLLYPKAKEEWTTPLGPALELPTYTPAALRPAATQAVLSRRSTPLASPEPASTRPAAAAITQTAAPLPASTLPPPTPQPLCGGPPVMTVLAVGADSGIDYLYGLADVIRIARVDFVTPKISVLSMPRDLWVELPPGVGKKGDPPVTHSKLNQTYFYGNPGMGYYTEAGAGPGLLARALDLNFGLRVDHYGAVNMQTFVKIVDAVGGIDIFLPTDVDGSPIDEKTADMGYFNAGEQHFSGEEALRFARIRKRYNDFTRMDHQNMVLCSLREKLLTPAVLPKVPQIVSAFNDSVLTDLSPEQFGQMACLLPYLERENILFTSLPQEILTPGRVYSPIQKSETFVMQADYDVIREYVSQFMSGSWPDEPKEPTCP